MSEKAAPARFAQLDALRALAAGIVMIHHYYTGDFFLAGYGVTLFFILSTFFVTKSLLKYKDKIDAGVMRRGEGLKAFYLNRWLRLWPLYYLLLVLTFICDVDEARPSFLWNAAFLSNVQMLVTGSWTGRFSHLWSLSVLEQFYLLWPVLIFWCPRRFLPWLIWLTIGEGVVYGAGCLYWNAPSFYWFLVPFASFDTLGSGALLAWCLANPGSAAVRRIEWSSRWIFLPLFLVLFVAKFFNYDAPYSPVYMSVVTSLALLAIINHAMTGFPGVIGRIFESPLLVHIGRMSYSIFLLHEFTELLIPDFDFLEPVMHSNLRVFVLIPATILLSHIAWRVIEFPLLSLLQKYRASTSMPTY